jgi:exonuclease VII small subunit
MATYSDGPLADVTKLVSWTIPQPALLAFDAGTGFARLHGAGTFKLAATLSGVRSNEVTVIAKDPSPPPKPPAWPEKVDFKPSLSTALNLEVGQSVSFVAIATMSDGSKRDLTGELRWLADTPTVFAFPKPGLLKAIGAGEGRFTVFGDQLRQSNAAAYGSGNVFGPAPKKAPKVPATGKLTTKAARIMAENLKWLGQPGYLTFGSKVDPGALASTGQAPLDALLKMAADVIRLWWNFQTLLAARQLWKGVHPKLLALLKEAATPAVGLTVKELNPAYDALVGMNDFVTDLKNRAVEANYIRKTTPFGIVEALWADRLPLEDMIGSYDEAGSLLPKLQGALRSLETKVGQLPKVVHDLKAMQAEITRRATEEAEREAKPLQLQARIVEILTMEFSSLETHFKNIKQHVDLALDHVNIEGSRQGLDQMRREAADTHARVNMFVDTLQTIGSTVLDPKSGIVAVMDLAQDLFVNYVDTDLSDKIKRLEEATSQYAIDTAYAEYKLCESDLENIKTKMANVKTLLEKNLQGLRVMEKDVNDSYDENRQPGGLSLTQLASVFEQAQAASPLPTPVHKSAEAAALKTSRLLRMIRVQNGEPLYDGGNRTILEDVRKDALRMSDEAVKAGTRIEEIKRSLMAIRAVAYEAVFSSKFNRAQQKKPTVP